MNKTVDELAAILHLEQCSCVIANHGSISLCHERGVNDLLRLLKSDPSMLSGAMIADRVIGKGAAALMILGGVKEAYADVISVPALELFKTASVHVSFAECVPNIINRAGTGICPVEALCSDCQSAEDCLPLIENFIKSINIPQSNASDTQATCSAIR